MVVDASVAVQWFAHEPASEAAARLIEDTHVLVAPDLMAAEAANAWWKKVRLREMEPADVPEAVVDLLALGIEWVPAEHLLPRAARMAVEIDHPLYDCLYLALAVGRGASLATTDDRLRRAAVRLELPLWGVRARVGR